MYRFDNITFVVYLVGKDFKEHRIQETSITCSEHNCNMTVLKWIYQNQLPLVQISKRHAQVFLVIQLVHN